MHSRMDALDSVVGSLEIKGSTTSYFSNPENTLDPQLFDGEKVKPWVRNVLVRMINDFLSQKFINPDLWTIAWIAGSGASYQWRAQRSPGDLDVLVGVDYEMFRKLHNNYTGLSDTEISKMINEDFREGLMPNTTNWEGYEVTFYVNPGATDIRIIKPYAAYDLTHDEWTVHPDPTLRGMEKKEWEQAALTDNRMAKEIVKRYADARAALDSAKNDAARRNAEYRMGLILEQASALFEDIHSSRKNAFSPSGTGYGDFYNYRWQAGKRLGTVDVLRRLHDYHQELGKEAALKTYGVELPTTETLIRRAATYRTQ
jgi:hypothetical protein